MERKIVSIRLSEMENDALRKIAQLEGVTNSTAVRLLVRRRISELAGMPLFEKSIEELNYRLMLTQEGANVK